jgi:peptide/nickel transport system permease protein
MTAYLTRRLLSIIPLGIGVSVVLFILMQLAPGGPEFMLLGGVENPVINRELAARLREQMGLDAPIHVQYWRWFTSALSGDFGQSFFKGRPVMELISQRLGRTLVLTGSALTLAILLAIPIGIVSAVRQYSLWDYAGTTFALVGLSLPNFWLAILLILLFAVRWKLFPISGVGPIGQANLLSQLHHLVLPAAALATADLAILTRFVRSSILDVLGEDYIRTARGKGLAETVVMYRHALRNALIPVVTVIGLRLPSLIGGSVVIETIFAYPGIGLLAIESTILRDYPVIMGIAMLVAFMVIMSNLLVDLLYVRIDPRIRF